MERHEDKYRWIKKRVNAKNRRERRDKLTRIREYELREEVEDTYEDRWRDS